MDAVIAAGVFLNGPLMEGLTSLESRPQLVVAPSPHPLATVSAEARAMLRDRVVARSSG